MIEFFEYVTQQQAADPLGTPEAMLARAGIWPGVPHEVVIKRMLKRWKKQALVPARPRAQVGTVVNYVQPSRPSEQRSGRRWDQGWRTPATD